MFRPILGALACASTLAMTAAMAPSPARAEMRMGSEPAVTRLIVVPKDKSLAFRLPEPASRIVVAQDTIAQVVATSDRSFYVRGKDIGSTNLLVYGPGGRLDQVIDLNVTYDATAMQEALAAAFPGEHIQVRNVGEGLLLSGEVSNTSVSDRAEAMAEQYAPKFVTNNLTVRASEEVVLEVRVLEAARSVVRDMGISADIQNGSFHLLTGNGLIGADAPNALLRLTGKSGSTSIDAEIAALENKGLVHTLARPNLVAVSGQKASFLAGGEYPYPVPQSSSGGSTTITIDFREYGVKLDFKPIVENNGLIRLEVAPEVSQLDPTNSLRVAGFTVPGLITRRTSTTVEMHDGTSLAIGGLFQRDYQNQVSQVPGLGEIPVLSALFRSTRWQNNETELVILVTPHIVGADDFANAKKTAAAVMGAEPTPGDLILQGQALDKPLTRDGQGTKR